MATFILFNTDYQVEIRNAPIKKGRVNIDGYSWTVDNSHQLTIKGLLGRSEPVYLLKWNLLYPVDWEVKETNITRRMQNGEEVVMGVKRELVPVVPKFERITPEMLGSISDMKFLKEMKSYATAGGFELPENFLQIAVFGVFILAVLGFLLTYGIQQGWFKQILGI